jgi:hypothetical protein
MTSSIKFLRPTRAGEVLGAVPAARIMLSERIPVTDAQGNCIEDARLKVADLTNGGQIPWTDDAIGRSPAGPLPLRGVDLKRRRVRTRFRERLSIGRASALKGLHSPNAESASASAPIAPQSRRGMS